MALPQPSLARLPDGRTLSYSEFGDPDGFPIVCNHHWLGSRLDFVPIAIAAAEVGVRLISPDRPGFGHSAPLADRTLIGWAADVHALTRTLDIDTYSVIGWSGGAPSTIACAFALGEYVKRVGIVSGFGPLFAPAMTGTLSPSDRRIVRLGRRGPRALRASVALARRRWRRGNEVAEAFVAEASATDRRLLTRNPDLVEHLATAGDESFRQGSRGPAADLGLMLRPWGFELSHISTEVLMWHGTDDDQVHVENALEYQRLLLNPRLTLLDGAGHLIMFDHAAEMLTALKAGAPIAPS